MAIKEVQMIWMFGWRPPMKTGGHLNTLLCMNYSENEVAPMYNEDFTSHFAGNIDSGGARIDVLTIVHHAISFDEAEKISKFLKFQMVFS